MPGPAQEAHHRGMSTELQEPVTSDWRVVDEGWGRRAVDFATLSEPANCREYVALHQHLGVGRGDRLLDVACGAGLAIELAAARGATCAGIDASARLVHVAASRTPGADLRVGDMHALPWADESFDVVTSFRGIWGTTPDALAEVHRVLVSGGRIGLTVWGHIKASPGAWALAPFRLAPAPKVANQARMVALGRAGAGEQLLEQFGFVDIERATIPFAWEFADPDAFARALASTGPAFEAIQAVGEDAFHREAVDVATSRVRDGLPLRATIDVVGYTATKRAPVGARRTFLAAPPATPQLQEVFDADVAQNGFVMNASLAWGHQPGLKLGLFDLLAETAQAAALTFRQRGVLVAATASSLGDSYCSLAWGNRLAGAAGDDVAAGVLRGDDRGLEPAEQRLAAWARRVTGHATTTSQHDIGELRDAGFDDAAIVAITTFVALRVAFSTVNNALGARPDAQLLADAPAAVRDSVTYGRPASADASTPTGSITPATPDPEHPLHAPPDPV
jgi:SAM-dependent methyltransferase/alkylhydroperoxidase family enzyme